jgi:TonB-dependent starch-binding outer membrane protein SusC
MGGGVRTRTSFVIAALWAAAGAAAAQGQDAIRVTGRVIDVETKGPVPAGTVLLTGTAIGTQTSDSGTFVLRVPPTAKSLTARRIGYQEATVLLVAGQTDYTIALQKDILHLEAQVVTGVATSISSQNAATYDPTVTGAQLVGAPTPTLENALQGKVPGAFIEQNSGAPGGGLQIQIRGVSSINVNAQPLYVIDGVIANNDTYESGLTTVSAASGRTGTGNQDQSVNRIADINPADIESIQVLEGAAASSIYGDKAAAGVVLITTKKGSAGPPQVSVMQRFGTNTLANEIDVRRFTLGQAYAQGSAVGLDSAAVLHNYTECGGFCDSQEQLYGGGELSYETDVSVRGGNATTSYYVSGLNKYDNGVQLNTGYNKQSVRANVAQTFSSKLSASVNLFYSSSLTRTGVNGNDNYSIAGYDVISYTPSWFNMDAHNADGSYVLNPFGTANAIADAFGIATPDEVNRFTGGATITYQPISTATQSLKAVFVGGIDAVNERYEFYADPDLQVEKEAPAVPGQATYLSPYGRLGNYSLSLVHVFSGLPGVTATTSAGFTRDQHQTYQLFTAGAGLAAGQQNLQYALDQNLQLQQTNVINEGFYAQEQVQLLDDRLTITGGVNAEASTNNGNVNAYYPFPKASVSYRFSNLTSWLDELKPRFAFGQSGNTPTYGVRVTQDHQSLDAGQTGVTYGDTLGNPNIRPETSTDFETGFDATLFKGRGGFSLTVYQKQITNLLLLAGTPPSTGAQYEWINGGKFTNQGIELSVNAAPVQTRLFSWTTQLTFARNYSRVDALPTPPFQTGYNFGYNEGGFYIEDGNSLTTLWGYKTPGGALVPIANAAPAFTSGWANDLSYGPFQLHSFLEWDYGLSNSDGTEVYFDEYGTIANVAASQKRLAEFNEDVTSYVQGASFLKLRELTLSYTLPTALVHTVRAVKGAHVSLSGRNLITVTKYPGLDPEVSNFGAQQIGRGIDVTPYPPARSYFVSLDLDF